MIVLAFTTSIMMCKNTKLFWQKHSLYLYQTSRNRKRNQFFTLPEIEEESYSSNNLGFHFSLEMSQLAGGWRQTELETEKFETERDGGPWSQMTWLLQTSDCLMLHHQACHCSALFCIFQPLQWWWPGWYLVRQ